ncbi:hypothetical protein AN639_04820 [Candidatus Epulonipiscium fishelsonii]|uniref:Uncharacterized protein n=1 Tax=Candidatus Epulonipiscium fishelsonii TaxID=77094 RepID=A0ACC8XDC4_9FIRM|nr:hypothetical protein AN639_04820 [Epulopiscium sp. SCG-B05WGA-EpuloA1]ONI40802.1 hypothetical protein AN396_05125 [Epulopiscium sp. SCG-B11WGA-EpuloA1]
MKKLAAILLALITFTPNVAYGAQGDIGYFGGTSPGYKLKSVAEAANPNAKPVTKYTLPYKENIYLSGKAVSVEGTIELKPVEIDFTENPIGSYKESYIITAESDDGTSQIARTVDFNTNYIYDAGTQQLTKSSEITGWTETVVVEGITYTLDQELSSFSKSLLEDRAPGVNYYSGDIYYNAVYTDGAGGDNNVTMQVDARVYGYDQAFAASEVQRRNISIDTGTNQYYIEETPTYTTYRDMLYSSNEPQAISLAGNYKEIARGSGIIQYNVLLGNDELQPEDAVGTIIIEDSPRLEQLPIPYLSQLMGHPAKSDIERMYSMKVFDVNPRGFSANQPVTRGEYIEMLVKALQIPIPATDDKKNPLPEGLFSDISIEHSLYPYAVAAYNVGLIQGGSVNPYEYLNREQMYVFNIRALGLERLGLGADSNYTPFLDDSKIADYAKNSIYAANKLGIIPFDGGYIFPDKYVSYADCAAFLNSYFDYLRYDLQKDYNQYMLF